MTGTHSDVSEQKQAEVQREMFIQELGQKNAELERFTYTVSHDLKSPLLTIKWYSGLLDEDVGSGDPGKLKTDIRRITEASDRMLELLADLLRLSRIGRVVSPPEKISFGIIAHEASDSLAGPLSERGIAVEITHDLPEVIVDHARIREALISLIENAFRAVADRPDPIIRIGADMTGTSPVFFVQDNGIGIDAPYLERIFNLFEKLDPLSPGTGVGLTIVKRIIETHGGKIWAESEGKGMGATFRFTLP
jgi:signal transduction histidine kinase